jgi:hypothetical protein
MTKKRERDEEGKLLPGHEIRKTSGAWMYLHTLRVPGIKGRRRIQKHLDELRVRLKETVPGSEDVRRELIIGQVIKTEGFLILVEEYLKRAGILDPVAFRQGRLEVQGSLGFCISLMNTQRLALQSLGLDLKDTAEILTPYEIVAQETKKK